RPDPHGLAAGARGPLCAARRLMTEPQFDELIHPSTRLSLVAVLASTDWADFSYLKDRLNLSDSALSKQLTTLESAEYVTIDRRVTNRRRRVRAQLTDMGRQAFE